MDSTSSQDFTQSFLTEDLLNKLDNLSTHPHRKLIQKALKTIIEISDREAERLDWKILTASLEDLANGFKTFDPYTHTRKISIFGSARIAPDTEEYKAAYSFARRITKLGFMVITGAGGGIMDAGNKGSGTDNSFGLNIQLPFEQTANSAIHGDEKLVNFKYFFTRKLFFLKESDAIALFPGGFGTQDEAFETLTLCQTGKYGPVPLVLIDKPGGDYWHTWNQYVLEHLAARGLISIEDPNLYTITDDLDIACQTIRNFYRNYHSSRYVDRLFVMRINCELSDDSVAELNEEFSDILTEGKIEQTKALAEENDTEIEHLPRLVFYLNRRYQGRLYQMIKKINHLDPVVPREEHPEKK